MIARPRAWDSWAVAALFVALTILLAYPLSVTANRTLAADDPDGHLFMWTLAWDAHAFLHQPLAIFDANIFHPNRDSLAYSENLIGSAFFATPVLWLSGNPVLAVNVVSLLSCVLCGLGAYVLGRRVGLSVAAAVLTGIVFAFSPPRFFRFSQLHLAAVQWIPFALASLHAYLEGGRKRDLRLAIAFFSLQCLTSGHGAVFAAVGIVLMLAYRLALGEPIDLLLRVRDVGIAGALLLVPVVLLAIPYRVAQVDVGLRRVFDPSGTPLQNFIASPTRVDAFLQSLVTSQNVNEGATAWLFPGFLPVLLAFVAVVGGMARWLGRTHSWGRAVEKPDPAFQSRRALLVGAIAALSWAVLGAAPSLLHAGDGLTPQYYANDRVAWTGYLTVRQPGLYGFGFSSDHARLTIDNRVVIDVVDVGDVVDSRADRPGTPTTGSMPMGAGSHRILIERARPGERPAPDLLWAREGDGQGFQPVPGRTLSRRPVSIRTMTVVRVLEWIRIISAIIAALVALWYLWTGLAGRRAAWIAWGAQYRRDPVPLYLLLTTVSAGLALGGRYGLWQFVYWLPGFNFIRGSSRFMVLGLLGVAVLTGAGFDRLTARLAASGHRLAAVVIGGLLLAEFSAIPFKGVPYRLDIPAADMWVAGQRKPFSVAEVPVTTSERYHSNYMLHSMAHWQKTVHGFSGIRPALHEELYAQLRRFPSEDGIRHLAKLNVTYVIVHSSWFSPDERRVVEEGLPAFDSWLKLEYVDEVSRVYSIRRPSQAPKEDP